MNPIVYESMQRFAFMERKASKDQKAIADFMPIFLKLKQSGEFG